MKMEQIKNWIERIVSFWWKIENSKLPEWRLFKNRIVFNFRTYSAVLSFKTRPWSSSFLIISANWESIKGQLYVIWGQNYYAISAYVPLKWSNVISRWIILYGTYSMLHTWDYHCVQICEEKSQRTQVDLISKGHETFWRLRELKYMRHIICLHRIYFGLESKWSSNTTCLVLWFVPKSKTVLVLKDGFWFE